MAYGLLNGHGPMTWRDTERSNSWPQIHLKCNISKTTWARDFKFGMLLYMGNAERGTNNFPWKWAWPRSYDPYNFWHTIEHISKTTWARDFKFGMRLCMGNAEQAHSHKCERGFDLCLKFFSYACAIRSISNDSISVIINQSTELLKFMVI